MAAAAQKDEDALPDAIRALLPVTHDALVAGIAGIVRHAAGQQAVLDSAAARLTRALDEGVDELEGPAGPADTVLQGHSLEDGVFTSDRIRVGSRSCLGVGAFVHHGTTIGEDCLLEADSFLVKGEQMPDSSVWGGNPAEPRREAAG